MEAKFFKPISDVSNRVSAALRLFFIAERERDYIGGNVVLLKVLSKSVISNCLVENPTMYEYYDMVAIIQSIDNEYVKFENKRSNRKADGIT